MQKIKNNSKLLSTILQLKTTMEQMRKINEASKRKINTNKQN